MKKFNFTLAKLMEIKEQELKQQKERLSELRKKQITLEEEKDELLRKSKNCNDDFNQKMATVGLGVNEIQSTKVYLMRLRDDMLDLDNKIVQAIHNVEMQVQVVAAATMDLRVVEKLKEKKLEEYNKELLKDEEHFIEEYINTAKHMSRENE
ncbi:MAG: flagellar FliJ family protein [Oscillospiraceae bacterium]